MVYAFSTAHSSYSFCISLFIICCNITGIYNTCLLVCVNYTAISSWYISWCWLR